MASWQHLLVNAARTHLLKERRRTWHTVHPQRQSRRLETLEQRVLLSAATDTAGDEVIDLGNGANAFLSAEGDDEVMGHHGGDILISRYGDDILRGGIGDDTIVAVRSPGETASTVLLAGYDGDDRFLVNNVVGTVNGGGGYDTLVVPIGADISGVTLISIEEVSYQQNAPLAASVSTQELADEGYYDIPANVGDVNEDGNTDALDFDILGSALDDGIYDAKLDIFRDGVLDQKDLDHMVHGGFVTYYGDTDLSGKVDIIDLGNFGANWGKKAGWLGGDFNGDGVVGLTDLDKFQFGKDANTDLLGSSLISLSDNRIYGLRGNDQVTVGNGYFIWTNGGADTVTATGNNNVIFVGDEGDVVMDDADRTVPDRNIDGDGDGILNNHQFLYGDDSVDFGLADDWVRLHSFSVNSTNDAATNSGFYLHAGVSYRIKVSGFVDISNIPNAPLYWATDAGWTYHDGTWYDAGTMGTHGTERDWGMRFGNSADVSSHTNLSSLSSARQETGVYTFGWSGDDSNFYANFEDDAHTYGDNAGSFTVEIYVENPVDIDVDSDNNRNKGLPQSESNELEEFITKGKFLDITSGDYDEDGISDYADFNGISAPGKNLGFTPLVLNVDLALLSDLGVSTGNIDLKFTYDDSHPDLVTSSGAQGDGLVSSSLGGNLRIWETNGFLARPVTEYIASGETINASLLGLSSSGTKTLWVEAVGTNERLTGSQIKVEATWLGSFIAEDIVYVQPVGVDLDIDSDNNNGFDSPEGTDAEEDLEDKTETQSGDPFFGKIVMANLGDGDEDDVPDYIDGQVDSNGPLYGDSDFQDSSGARFTPIVVTVPENVDLNDVRVRFDYSFSNPDLTVIQRTGNGVPGDPYLYGLPQEHMRIWTKDGSESRNQLPANNGGDLVIATDGAGSGEFTLAELGFEPGERSATLWVEAMSASATASDRVIKVEIDPDGPTGGAWFFGTESVRFTGNSLEILDANQVRTYYAGIANWDNAYTDNGWVPSGDPGIVGDIRRTKVSATADIVELDDERLYVRLRAPQLNVEIDEMDEYPISISTITPEGHYDASWDSYVTPADYSDDPTVIRLQETGVDTGIFLTQSQMLVANDHDDDFEPASGLIWQDDVSQIAFGANFRPNGDRTHKIGLGGAVKASFEIEGIEYTTAARVEKVKQLSNISVKIVRDSVGGSILPRSVNDVVADIIYANEIFAQSGIFISMNAAGISEVNPVASYLENNGPPDPVRNVQVPFGQDVVDFANIHGTPATDDIIIFYVQSINVGATIGFAQTENIANLDPTITNNMRNNIFLAGGDVEFGEVTLAHELIHILADSGHDGGPQHSVLFEQSLGGSEERRRITRIPSATNSYRDGSQNIVPVLPLEAQILSSQILSNA